MSIAADRVAARAPGLSGLSHADLAGIMTDHLDHHEHALAALRREIPAVVAWGVELADRMLAGARLFAAGNGGSAAEAQHLTAELVGRFDGERSPFPATALHAETSTMTAIANDYGYDHVFARQVRAHARAGDVLVLLTTSGRSRNLVEAALAAREVGATSWLLCGAHPSPAGEVCDEVLTLHGTPAAAQEAQLVAVHLLCRVFDARVREAEGVR